MTLEDFEKSLEKERRSQETRESSHRKHRDRDHKHHSHRHHSRREEEDEDRHRRKRRRHSSHEGDEESSHRSSRHRDRSKERHHRRKHDYHDEDTDVLRPKIQDGDRPEPLKRDSWMVAPAASDVEFVQRKKENLVEISGQNLRAQFEADLREDELKHQIEDSSDDGIVKAVTEEPANQEVSYTFGDDGSEWRMRKLKNVYKQAEVSKKSVEEVALKQYGNLRDFDDAREEEIELERRQTYGQDYVGKEKPSGELFLERKLDLGVHREPAASEQDLEDVKIAATDTPVIPPSTFLDQTSLNRLKAKMMKAKLRGDPDAAKLEAEYNAAITNSTTGENGNVVVLGTMQNRMLTGGRGNEVKNVDTKRGRERGLVEENEDMSIEDMVREERRNRGQNGGEGLLLAQRIAKDGKFTNDLEYMDENANKLAKRVQRSEINLKNSAIADFRKVNNILDNCPLCHHEDQDIPPIAPVVSLATRVYLTIPTEPELAKYGACIAPIQHRNNLLECDDDEWEEIRNFMKSLTRLYHGRRQKPIFYENAARPGRHPHAAMMVIPMAPSLQAQAPAFFREAILSSAPEWSQHRKLINTQAKADEGMGRSAFKRSIAKEMPYFHAWFSLDGGLGHIVEDENTWPRGDLFAREVLAGMLRVGPEVWRKQGHWVRGDARVDGFRKIWSEYDWTRQLVESG